MQVKLILHIEDMKGSSLISPRNTKDDPKNDPKNDPKELTERQRNILHTIEEDTSLTREQLTQRLNVSDSTIKREISFLRKEGYLDRKGGNTYGTWVILKSFK